MRLLLLIVVLALVGGVYYLKTHPELLPSNLPSLHELPQRAREVIDETRTRLFSPSKTSPAAKPTKPEVPRTHPITLYLTNGGVVTGELVRETSEEIVLSWEYGEAGFARAEIARIVRAERQEATDDIALPWEGAQEGWAYQHDVVVKLMKGTVVDAKLTQVTPESLILVQTLPAGGTIEHTIARKDVDQLLFKPIRNKRSEQIRQTLQTLFPTMHVAEEGMFTIFTDSPAPSVKDYRRTVRELATDWYLTFFALTDGRAPKVQQHLVIFDDWISYIEYAMTDGVPGWLAVGYFHPEDEVLYSFNMVGEGFSQLLELAYLSPFRSARDRVSQQVKDSRYAVFIEGQMSEFLQAFEKTHATVRQLYAQVSIDILRHELTHAMFHNWGLQGIILSHLPSQSPDEVEQKRRFLESDDPEQKRQLLEALLKREQQTELPHMQADNSWFVEGLAGYMEPSPLGGINTMRLPDIQQARRINQVLPLEFLHTFRMGSFVGMATQSQLYAYAQSWAMCHFLLTRYPEGFLRYLDRLAREQPKEGEDTLYWLVDAVGKPQRQLEAEWLVHLDQFPPEDPFWLKQMQLFLDLRQELIHLMNRL